MITVYLLEFINRYGIFFLGGERVEAAFVIFPSQLQKQKQKIPRAG